MKKINFLNRAGFALFLFALLLFGAAPSAHAREASANPCIPDEAAIEAYTADGTLAERLAFYEGLGLNTTDPGLIAEAKAREDSSAGLRSAPSSWKTGMPTSGDAKILLIRVDFPDYQFEEGDTEEALNAIAFGPADEKHPAYPYESLAAYYERSSYGKLRISGKTASYRAKHNRDFYAGDTSVLFTEAMTALHENGLDFSQFDGNHDGQMDGIYIHFAGPGTGWASTWWSFKNHYSGPPFVLDGVQFTDYVFLHEASAPASGAQTLIHETGHMLGIPDYYSYEKNVYENGIRTFDMMCDNTGDHNGFSKWLLGWIDPADVTRLTADSAETALSLTPISGSAPSKIAVVSPRDSGIFSEYFLVQYDVPGLNNEGIHGIYPDAPASGFRVFHVNATLNADGTNFLYQNSNPRVPKLIEAVGPENQTLPFTPLFYTDGMRLVPDTTPDSSFFGGMYQAYTGAVMENFDTRNAGLSVRFEHTPPVVPPLSLTPDSPMDNLTNLPTFVFTANIPLSINTSGSATQPVMLVGPDGASYPMHCTVREKKLALGPVAGSNLLSLKADTEYTLIFPEKYFDLAQGVLSETLRFPVKTGDIPALQSSGVLNPSFAAGRETELAALPDGRIFRFIGHCKSSGESILSYFDQIQLLIADSDFQTSLVNVAAIPDIESYSDIQGAALSDHTLALALYNPTADTTALFSVDLSGRVLSGPYTLNGSPSLFPAGGSVKAWRSFYDSDRDLPCVQIETIDFKNSVTSHFIFGESFNSALKLFPIDASQYAVHEETVTGLWEYRDYLSLYSMDSVTPKWRTECTSVNAIIGAAAQEGGITLIEMDPAGETASMASASSQYKNILATTFDKNGRVMEMSKSLGRIRSGIDSAANVISVKGGVSGIAVESSFSAPALPFADNDNDTMCRDYLFISSDGRTRAISGQNAYPGLWTGERYLITGLGLDTGETLYYQTDTIFADTHDTPVTPDIPDTPGVGLGAPADTGNTGDNLPTGVLGNLSSLYACLSFLAAALCGLALYRKNS